jgi:hypothetical protein
MRTLYLSDRVGRYNFCHWAIFLSARYDFVTIQFSDSLFLRPQTNSQVLNQRRHHLMDSWIQWMQPRNPLLHSSPFTLPRRRSKRITSRLWPVSRVRQG